MQHTATHCNTLQRTATHCNALHYTATHYTQCVDVGNPQQGMLSFDNSWNGLLTVWQVASADNGYYVWHSMRDAEPHLAVCIAVCCNVLQCIAVCCSVLQCVAVWQVASDDKDYFV